MKQEADEIRSKLSYKQEKLEKATIEYARATIKARASGVDVAGVHLEVQEQARLSFVKCIGALLGVISVYMWPILIPAYKVFCFKIGMPYDLQDWYYYWPCVVGAISIIAFAYDLVDPRTLKRISGPSDSKHLEQTLSRSGKVVVYKPTEDENENGSDGSV